MQTSNSKPKTSYLRSFGFILTQLSTSKESYTPMIALDPSQKRLSNKQYAKWANFYKARKGHSPTHWYNDKCPTPLNLLLVRQLLIPNLQNRPSYQIFALNWSWQVFIRFFTNVSTVEWYSRNVHIWYWYMLFVSNCNIKQTLYY